MAWLEQGVTDRLRATALALTAEERAALTWEGAREFVANDTMEITNFEWMRQGGQMTPWQAVALLRGISDLEGA